MLEKMYMKKNFEAQERTNELYSHMISSPEDKNIQKLLVYAIEQFIFIKHTLKLHRTGKPQILPAVQGHFYQEHWQQSVARSVGKNNQLWQLVKE